MNLPDWLDAETGRLTRMAGHFKVSPPAITQWRSNGVPVARMLDVREFTGGEVTVEEMVSFRTERQAPTEAAA